MPRPLTLTLTLSPSPSHPHPSHPSDLLTLTQAYLVPMRETKVLTPQEHSFIFSNVEEVLKIHQELLTLLEAAHHHPEAEPSTRTLNP